MRPVTYADHDLLTAEQFITMARESYAYGDENLGEREAQYKSECAMFGDAGPGQLHTIRAIKADLAQMRETYHRLTGRDLARDCHPISYGD